MEKLQSSHSIYAWSAHVKVEILSNSVSIRINGAEVQFCPFYGDQTCKNRGYDMARHIHTALEKAMEEHVDEV